jgi:PAS domain S-box-containing protein
LTRGVAPGTLEGMPGGPGGLHALDSDVEAALESISIPSYVIDQTGVIRWTNGAAKRCVGDVRGRQFTSVVAPEDTRRAREVFAQKIAGTALVTDSEAVLLDASGTRIDVEISSVPLRRGDRVIGVFGQFVQHEGPAPPMAHPSLTPRQTEILVQLQRGRSTRQIAEELHLSPETVRNHVRHVLKALGVHSRLEAVAVARREHLIAN